MRWQLPVHSPISPGAIASGVSIALGAGDTGLGPRVSEALADRFGARDVLLVDSGTSALRLALAGVGRDRDAVVGVPGYTCYDMASAVEGASVTAALYDVHARTLGPDLDSLRRVCASGVSAVVVGHLFGHLVDLAAVREVVGGDTLLIEDSAQGVGGAFRGSPLGSFGSVSILSFGRGKGMTGGGGGALLAHDERGAAIVEWARGEVGGRPPRGIRPMIALVGQWALGRPLLYGIPSSLPFLHLGETVYHPPRVPEPPPDASLGVLSRVMPLVDSESGVRRRNAARLQRALGRSPRLAQMKPVRDGEAGCLRLPALIQDGARAEALAGARRLGVASGYPTTLTALPSLTPHLATPVEDLPGSERLAESLVTLPTHGLLSESDLDDLERWIVDG